MNGLHPTATLVLFHLQSGGRVALRSVIPLAGGIVAAGVLAGSPLIVLAPVASILFPEGHSSAAAAAAVALFVLTFKWLGPRLTRGLNGWMRHLPASGATHRRAVTFGLMVASLPIILFVASAGVVSIPLHPFISLLRLAALPVVVWASALAALPLRPWVRLLSVIAATLSFFGSPEGLMFGIGGLVVSDLGAGPVRGPAHRGISGRTTFTTSRWSLQWIRITFRALGLRFLSGPLSSALVLGPLVLFLHNNTLSPFQESVAIRFAALAAGIVGLAVVADALVVRRPPWPWIRSLPFSSATRVAFDATIVGIVAAPALAVAGFLDLESLAPLMGVMPLCALRAVSAIRIAPGKPISASGTILLEGGLMAVAVAVWPWMTLPILVLTPLAFRAAVRDDQGQEVSRWHELHHLAAGDSLSWSDQ